MAQTVTLKSLDNMEFKASRNAAVQSGLLKEMLEEEHGNVVEIPVPL
jgi:hypothetical protein